MGFRVPDEETVLGAIEKVLSKHSTLPSQRRLAALVRKALARSDRSYRVSDERVRRLALVRGLVDIRMRTGTTQRPAPEDCPVCEAPLRLVKNRTLGGGTTVVGTRCARCPYRSGPQREVPLQYEFVRRGVQEEPARAEGPF